MRRHNSILFPLDPSPASRHLTPVRGILFDKDGTLLDFEASWTQVYQELCLDLAAGDPATAEAMLVTGGFDKATGRFRSGGLLAAGNTRDIVEAWYPALSGDALTALIEHIDETFYENGIRYSVPIEGLNETLDTLAAAGFRMGVATNDGTAGARAALKRLGIDHHLAHVFGYDSVARPKPAPDIVHAFAKATGMTAAEVVVIGDNLHDLEMARAAGAGAALGVLSGNSAREELAPFADDVLDSVRDLPGWLKARPATRA